jgi:hypothetical protein
LPVHDGPADSTGPGDDNTAVTFAMGAKTSGMRIGRDDGLTERVLLLLRGGKLPWLTGAG